MPLQPIPCATCGGSGGSGGGHEVEDLVLCDILPDGTIAGAAIAVYIYNPDGTPTGPPTFVIPGTNTPYVAQGILQPCDEPCLKCETAVLCDNSTTPAHEIVTSTIKMLDTVGVAGDDGWDVTGYNTSNVAPVNGTCAAFNTPPVPVPYPAFYGDWCALVLASCPATTPAGISCSLNPGNALMVRADGQGIGCNGGTDFQSACGRYTLEKSFNTDATCTKIRVTSQRFRADGSARVLIDGQNTGIFGQYNASSPDGAIVLTVAPGPHTMTIDLRDNSAPTWVQGGLTIECLDIAPATNTAVQFLRTTCRTCDGNILGVTDTTLDGTTPYVPGINVTICDPGASNIPTPCANCESYVLADRIVSGLGIVTCNTFLRRVCHNCDGSVSSTTDTLLDGVTPYVTTGAIGLGCNSSEDQEILCDGGNANHQFLRAFIRNPDGQVIRVTDSELDGTTGYTVIGPIVKCIDAFTGTVGEFMLCDHGNDSFQFIRKFFQDGAGVVFSTVDIALDGVPYAPIGPVGICDRCGSFNGEVCYIAADLTIRRAIVTRDCITDAVSYYDVETGADLPVVTTDLTPCPTPLATNGLDVEVEHLCDATGAHFLRRYVYNADTGFFASVTDTALDGSTPFAPVAPVGNCASAIITNQFDIEQQILCDSAGTRFIRAYVYDAETPGAVVITDTTLNGTTPFAPVGAVSVCASPTAVITRDEELLVLCDSAAVPNKFLRKYNYDGQTGAFIGVTNTLLDGTTAFVPTGAVQVCAATTVTRDEELLVLCDSAGTKFLRKYNYDGQTGAFIGVTNTTLDGTTAFAPVGAVGICTTTTAQLSDFLELVLCDANGTQFIQRLTFNTSTGAVTATTDTTLTGAAFVPVAPIALCSTCCPIVLEENLCTNTGSGRGVSIRNTNGTISLLDAITGAAITAANIVTCAVAAPLPVTLTAQARLVTNATPWTPGADVVGTLTEVSFTVITGTTNFVDQSGTAVGPLPVGVSFSWDVEDRDTLLGPLSVTPTAGSTVLAVWTQR